MTRLLIMGPPGAGKGTQAQLVAEHFGIPAISTGDIFRANVSNGTSLGVEAKRYMDAGEYVPDEITNNMLRDRLSEPDAADGFLLDGYPRTLSQVDFLDSVLAEQGAELDYVVELVVDENEIVSRLLKRAAEEGRTDDSEEVVRNRMRVYNEQTAPLTALYAERGLLVRVDGMGRVEEVAARVENAIVTASRSA
ncbi:adenylate kinase [Phytoactinopolyspora halophila]|nr:adenylate kinase [Phytoactinopolyspora halophila]